jgi:hypothetical protein
MTEKTYEDGVRAGFEACRDAAVAVCRERAKVYAENAEFFRSSRKYSDAKKCEGRATAIHFVTASIAALTPESPND